MAEEIREKSSETALEEENKEIQEKGIVEKDENKIQKPNQPKIFPMKPHKLKIKMSRKLQRSQNHLNLQKVLKIEDKESLQFLKH